MTNEEFKARFQNHPVGFCFQSMQTQESELDLQKQFCVMLGILFLLKFQGDITEDEYVFLEQEAKGQMLKNIERVKITNAKAPKTRQ